mgnify:CR=1 FL=1
MLSAICLEAGCERVTGIDTNMTMCHLAQNNLKSVAKWLRGIGRKGVRYEVLHCENGKPPADLRSREFDMMVNTYHRALEAARCNPPKGSLAVA